MKFLYVIFVVSLTVPLSANADWQMTRWGMSLEEYVVLGIAEELPTDSPHNTSEQTALYTMPYRVKNIDTNVIFYFSDMNEAQILSEVRVIPIDINNCAEIIGILRVTYGREESETKGSIFRYLSWRDEANGNRLLFSEGVAEYENLGCTVIYQPIPTANSRGGL